jgi:hypothetical protein
MATQAGWATEGSAVKEDILRRREAHWTLFSSPRSPLFKVEICIRCHTATKVKNLLAAKHIFVELLIPAANRECTASRGVSKATRPCVQGFRIIQL